MAIIRECNARRYGRRLSVILSNLLIALPLMLIPNFAVAQERQTLFDWLFGSEQKRAAPPPKRQQKNTQRPRNRTTSSKRANSTPSTPSIVQKRTAVPAPVTKLENAKTILVAGDFMAASLGDGLNTRFQTNAGIQIETKSNGSSGVVRSDYYDWQARLPTFVQETKPALTILMIGSNDRQNIRVDGVEHRFGTELWLKEYEKRLDALAVQAKQTGAKLLWVGLPSFQSPSFTADVLVLNRLYRAAAEKAQAEFIDIWDGFADESGKFITTGFDVNGQQARLREADGIALTKAGREKLAFYVERAILRYIDDGSISEIKLDGDNLPALSSLPALGVDPVEIRTQPVNVTDPELDGGKELLGTAAPQLAVVETPRQKLVLRGVMDEAPLGRIDDYRLPE